MVQRFVNLRADKLQLVGGRADTLIYTNTMSTIRCTHRLNMYTHFVFAYYNIANVFVCVSQGKF